MTKTIERAGIHHPVVGVSAKTKEGYKIIYVTYPNGQKLYGLPWHGGQKFGRLAPIPHNYTIEEFEKHHLNF